MRTYEQIAADAAKQGPFSNHSEYEVWAGSGRGCYDCRHDDTDDGCPILGAAILVGWPTEWTRERREWQSGDRSGAYDVVGECTEFDQRPDDDGPDDEPEPDPGPPPVIDGQIDMFEVFADRIAEQASAPQAVSAR